MWSRCPLRLFSKHWLRSRTGYRFPSFITQRTGLAATTSASSFMAGLCIVFSERWLTRFRTRAFQAVEWLASGVWAVGALLELLFHSVAYIYLIRTPGMARGLVEMFYLLFMAALRRWVWDIGRVDCMYRLGVPSCRYAGSSCIRETFACAMTGHLYSPSKKKKKKKKQIFFTFFYHRF
jgi:hypothetical protein